MTSPSDSPGGRKTEIAGIPTCARAYRGRYQGEARTARVLRVLRGAAPGSVGRGASTRDLLGGER